MKHICFALILTFSMALTSCGILRDSETADMSTAVSTPTEAAELTEAAADPEATEATEASADSEKTEAAEKTENVQTEQGGELPEEKAPVGLYDELGEAGTYTLMESLVSPWNAGEDIVVFDLIPSNHTTISGSASYKELWKHQAAVLGEEGTVKPYVILEYTLTDGSTVSREIRSYAEAEAEVEAAYIEVYLYDDVHQPDGTWYSHLTEYTTNGDTVISSVKLTAGAKIDSVSQISLTACLDGKRGSKCVLVRGE